MKMQEKGNHIGDEGVTRISESLMDNTTLTKLNLNCYNRFWMSMLNIRAIIEIKLIYNDIGPEGAAKLSESLKFNNTLTKLFFGSD